MSEAKSKRVTRTETITVHGTPVYKKAIKAVAADAGFPSTAEFIRFVLDQSAFRSALEERVKKFDSPEHNYVQMNMIVSQAKV